MLTIISTNCGCIMNGLPVSVCQGCYSEAAGWDDLYTRGWWCEAGLGAAVTTHCYYRYVTSTSHLTATTHMDDIDLDLKLRELEESVKCRRERRREQKKEMELELEKSLRKESSRSQDTATTTTTTATREVVKESEKRTAGAGAGAAGGLPGEERYVRELCETEKRIRQLESAISDLNFELEKIEVAETSGAGDRGLDMLDLDHGRVSAISTDI